MQNNGKKRENNIGYNDNFRIGAAKSNPSHGTPGGCDKKKS